MYGKSRGAAELLERMGEEVPVAIDKLNTKAKPRQNVHFLFRALRTHRRSRTRHRVSLPVERCTQWVPVSAPFNREAQ